MLLPRSAGSRPEIRGSQPTRAAALGGQLRLIHSFGVTIPALVVEAGRELSDDKLLDTAKNHYKVNVTTALKICRDYP